MSDSGVVGSAVGRELATLFGRNELAEAEVQLVNGVEVGATSLEASSPSVAFPSWNRRQGKLEHLSVGD